MISVIISRLVILLFGTLYPAYASYKAVRTKNVKEYVKWMMYWIVYAFFTCIETFTDIFLSWFPFYYEVKVLVVIWLLSPATKGSSTLYRKFVHPMLTRKEQEIDDYINQAKEKGYTAVLQLGSKGVNYATNVIMQTALKGGGNLMQTIRKSYSLSDLSEKNVHNGLDEVEQLSRQHRLLRPRSETTRSFSGARETDMLSSETSLDTKSSNHNYIRSSEDISSGYSSTEAIPGILSRTSSMTNANRIRLKTKRTENNCFAGNFPEPQVDVSLLFSPNFSQHDSMIRFKEEKNSNDILEESRLQKVIDVQTFLVNDLELLRKQFFNELLKESKSSEPKYSLLISKTHCKRIKPSLDEFGDDIFLDAETNSNNIDIDNDFDLTENKIFSYENIDDTTTGQKEYMFVKSNSDPECEFKSIGKIATSAEKSGAPILDINKLVFESYRSNQAILHKARAPEPPVNYESIQPQLAHSEVFSSQREDSCGNNAFLEAELERSIRLNPGKKFKKGFLKNLLPRMFRGEDSKPKVIPD